MGVAGTCQVCFDGTDHQITQKIPVDSTAWLSTCTAWTVTQCHLYLYSMDSNAVSYIHVPTKSTKNKVQMHYNMTSFMYIHVVVHTYLYTTITVT
jgi:hypothetical protein